jgi:hypothetical protein
MNLESMIKAVGDTTQIASPSTLIAALDEAQVWVSNRILVMDENILKVSNDQITLTGNTSTYDLAANVSTGKLIQIKWLGVKLSTDTKFHPVQWMDSSDEGFIQRDQSTTAASGHPVLAASENNDQVRFAPFLVSGDILRVDYIYSAKDLSLDNNIECDLPEQFHWAVVNKARELAFDAIDDDRAIRYERKAVDDLNGAANVLQQRQLQQRPQTAPFGVSRRRWYGSTQ